MNRIKKLSLLLLLTASLSTHAFTASETCIPDDDMTSFDDLAAAGHHLRATIKKDGECTHKARVFDLVNTYRNRRVTYTNRLYYYNLFLEAKEGKEITLQKAQHAVRSESQWRDYVILTTAAAGILGAATTLYELAQQEYLLALGCTAVTTGAYFAYGFGAEWADNARFTAADDLKKDFLIKEQDFLSRFQKLTEEKDKAEINLIQAYAALLAAKPRTPEAQALANTVHLPDELKLIK